MRILGIHDGHNATACLYEDGKIVGMVSEERFSRKKNQSGFPQLAINWLMQEYGVSAETLDEVAVASLITPMQEFGKQEGPWYSVASALSKVLPAKIMSSEALVKPYRALRSLGEPRVKRLAQHLASFKIPQTKIRLVEHHTAHAHAAYWLDFHRSPDPTLVITLDNTGDGLCGSVSIAKGPNEFQRIRAHQSLHSIGMLYTAITRYLGMKAVEDEYKVMGLAPYSRSPKADDVYQILRRHMMLSPNSLEVVNRTGLWENAYVERFRKELAGYRFDVVAAGVQRLFEELVTGYLKAWVHQTGIRRLALGGGVFMNVKANMLVNEMEDFDHVYFLPSCGDESLAAGAALKRAWELHRDQGKEFKPEPLGTLYLGPSFSNEETKSMLAKYQGRLQWRICENVELVTAKLLAENNVVGRMSGRMEFGARALGNRSILARADSLNNVRKINAAIKMRDFWMPFCPSMLWERRHDYVLNPKETPAPYMIMAFRSTPLARKEAIAALHPSDLSCRPQLVERDWNPKFHRLLKVYEGLTGSGVVLNTSFNLHGDPVVCSPLDAIDTYCKSDLDALTIEDYLIWDPERVYLEPKVSCKEDLFNWTPQRVLSAVTNSGKI
jgi:carbamoyltransferase